MISSGGRRPRIAPLLLVAGLTLAPVARGEEVEGLELRWRAPDGCPDAVQVESDIRRALTREFRATEAVRVDAHLTPRGPRSWTAEVVLSRPSGESHRTLNADSCPSVAQAVVLVVALALDPGLGELSETARTPEPDATPRAPTRKHRKSAGTTLHARFGGTVDTSLLPEPGLGPAVALGVGAGHFRAEVFGSYLLPATHRISGSAGARAEFRLLAAGLQGCTIWASELVEAGPCAGVEVGDIGARATGVATPLDGHALWLGARAAGLAAVRIARPFWLHASVAAALPLRHPSFVVEGVAGTIHRVEGIPLRIELGVAAAIAP